MAVTIFLKSAARTKPMKQTIPESWLTKRKPVEELVRHVAKTVLGREPEWDLVAVIAADGNEIDQSEAICDAMKDGCTYVIREEQPIGPDEDVNDPTAALNLFKEAQSRVNAASSTPSVEPPAPPAPPAPTELPSSISSSSGDVSAEGGGEGGGDGAGGDEDGGGMSPEKAAQKASQEASQAAFIAKVEAEYEAKHGSRLHPSDPYYPHYLRKAAAKEMSTSTALAHMQEDVNDKNGGSATWGWWEQTRDEAVAYVNLPPGTKGKMLRVNFTSTFVNAELLTTKSVLMQGSLSEAVIADDCHWELVDGVLELHLAKELAAKDCAKTDPTGWWPCILRTDKAYDITLCDREPFVLGEMTELQANERRSQIARMLGCDDPTEGRAPRVDGYD